MIYKRILKKAIMGPSQLVWILLGLLVGFGLLMMVYFVAKKFGAV
jgi:hypothetical protein